MWSMNKMSSSLISLLFSNAKAWFFMGIFNSSFCAHYQWLLLVRRTIGRGRGTSTFHLLYLFCLVFFCFCFCHMQELLLQIKKEIVQHLQTAQHCSERKDILPSEKDIHATIHKITTEKSSSGLFF